MSPDWVPVAELSVDYLQSIGIDASMREVSIELGNQRAAANELMASIGWTHGPVWPTHPDYLPAWGWGQAWSDWHTSGGTTGEEPPEWMKEVFDIHRAVTRYIPDSDEGQETVERLRDWYYENIPIFIMAEEVTYPMIFSERLGNVPHSGQAIAANYSGEQFFFRD